MSEQEYPVKKNVKLMLMGTDEQEVEQLLEDIMATLNRLPLSGGADWNVEILED